QMGLANALLAGSLALLALVVGRVSRRPALVHSLWVLVLLKLVTPPLVSLPVPGWHAAEEAPQAASEPRREAAEDASRVRQTSPEALQPAELPVAMKAENLAGELPRPVMPAAPAAVMMPDDQPTVTLISDPPEPVAPVVPSPRVERPDLLALAG